ncbi:septal ring lytic transglycosylase RlpA family protein [Phreatobacter sp.]|uniref:septal ring lytic transglycosylase RlpA family protein n=1 Tax=Phreatobacter sp. TaxID=1966341 RepID=UPI003F6EADA1
MAFSATNGGSRPHAGFVGIPASRLGLISLCAIGLALGGCAHQDRVAEGAPSVDRFNARYGVSSSPRVLEGNRPVPRGGGVYRVGRPYTIAGRRYVPYEKRVGHTEAGIASWYGRQFHGRLTANGEVYDMNALSAAHRTMPMPSYARVTNLRNGHSVVVRVNDRGPFHGNRVIDLSHRTANLLAFRGHGVARVRVEYLGRASVDGSDDRRLLATLRTDGSPAPTPGAVTPTMLAAAPGPAEPARVQPAVQVAQAPVTQAPAARQSGFHLASTGSRPVPAPVVQVAAATPSATMAGAPLPAARPSSAGMTATTTIARVNQPPQVYQAPAMRSGTTTTTVVAAPAAASAAPDRAQRASLSTASAFSGQRQGGNQSAPALSAMPAPSSRVAFGMGGLY